MTQPATMYVYYPVFRKTERWMAVSESERAMAVGEAQSLLDRAAPTVAVRGVYSAAGFRPDADLLMWWLSESPDALQDLLVEFRRSAFGRNLELTWAFFGLTRPAEFAPDHVPAFLRGADARRYISVYPFVRTADWYLLPPAERGQLLRAHGELGRDFQDVLTNTTQAFGLGDYEWILAFEADRLDRIVDMIRQLRAAEARRYTKLEVPFITGVKKDLAQVARDLG